MESPLKQRLIGAAVLAALAIIFLPMLLKGPDVKEPDAAEVPLSMPAAPGDAFETRELPLTEPAPAPAGVLGMQPAAPRATDATGEDEIIADTPADEMAPAAAAAPQPAPTAAAPTPAAPVPAPTIEPKAAPPAASTAARDGPEVAAGGHALTVGTFANTTSAASLAARLRAAGLPVLAERVAIASGMATRVRVGPFPSRAAAEAARQRVEQISGSPSRAVVLDAPALAPAESDAKLATPPRTATAKPAPATAAPAVVASGFVVQLSAPSVEADANALRDRARAAGFSAFVQRVDTPSGARFRVRLGPVADRSAAESIQSDARAKLGMAGIIVTNP